MNVVVFYTETLQCMTIRDAVDRYYEKLEGQGKPTIIDPNDFTLVDGKDLRLKRFPDVKLIKANGEPLKLSTIRSKYGADVIREGLGFSDYGYKKPQPKEKQILSQVLTETDNIGTAEDIELQTISDKASEGVENVINNTDGTDEVLPYRELRGLDRTLKTIRGNLAVQESKK